MTGRNQNVVSEFLLLGLPIESEHQNLFFVLFLAMYVTTILGNLLIIVLICLDPHLHTPMYTTALMPASSSQGVVVGVVLLKWFLFIPETPTFRN